MSEGKFFQIKSQLNEMALTVEEGDASAGQRVSLQNARRRPAQLWFEDEHDRRIRSFLNEELVLEVRDDQLILNEYRERLDTQSWRLAGEFIRNAEDLGTVLNVILGEGDEPGGDVNSQEHHGRRNQQWEFDYVPQAYFYIQSSMNGKVVDIARGNTDTGARVVLWDKNEDEENDNQLWWEDRNGNIRSKLNDFSFAADEGDDLRMEEFDPDNPSTHWAKCRRRIYNKGDRELGFNIRKAEEDNGARLCNWRYENADNEHWEFVYTACDFEIRD